MDGEQIKQAYLKLPDQERREVAHWILARELSGRAGASLQPTKSDASGRFFSGLLFRTVLGAAALLFLLVLLIFGGLHWLKTREQAAQKQSAAQLAAEEAKRPNSPANLGFLARSIGKEITIRGVPQDSDVGFLYFSKSRKQALSLNLVAGGIVLLQSGELEEMVRNKVTVEVQGILEKTEDGYYQIRVEAQNQLRILKP